ncbi:ABC transporter ATP-binding protein [Patiriisocius marinus]|uniref:ABC transporter ATP-binding protein n=1 Tax=Patiriisocius marinus TaxID=1397112 RepID=A0A5J4IWE3_9FLAO|nr:ABC transporter ATP-binding protein [Patiriisocius marinus]GER59176.1 ABC transporter ATP-binding protein [Patiriisocius marinus]
MQHHISEHIISAKNLSIGYSNGKKPAIIVAKDIDLSITKGQLIAIVGSNGIGKSTLLRTLAGIQSPLNGTIDFLDKPSKSYSPLELASLLSIVLTEAAVSKNLTVLELVSLGRQPYTNWMGSLSNNDNAIILEALEATQLSEIQHKKCFELSDGQLQRVYIARALAQDTPIILLDEPTTHLDLFHKASILKLLKTIAHKKQKTILFSTHEIDLAIQLTDTMIIMTPETTVHNTPCRLIEQNVFNTLFPEDFIVFDKMTGRFTIK